LKSRLTKAKRAIGPVSAFDALNLLEPKGAVTVTRDIPYASGARQRLDIYQPKAASGSAPVVVFLYGGGWEDGGKEDYAFAGAALASQGFVVVIPDYRLYPKAVWPQFLQDCARATAWAQARACHFGGDADALFLMGHSAGAYNAVMLASDARWLGAVGMTPGRDIAGVVGLAGPYDFLPLKSETLKIIFGPEAQRALTQPINHVDGRGPPLFLAADKGDTVVEPGNTLRMADEVRAAGGEVITRIYRGLSHALLMGAIAAPLRFLAPVLRDCVGFMRAHAHARVDWRVRS
jgi:acetyl esterase/lipase